MIALVTTGYWMKIDVPQTPNAVVACVIIFNAAFGYRYAPTFLVPGWFALIIIAAGVQSRGYILLK